MSTNQAFSAEIRSNKGTGAARALRKEEMVPGVIYGDNKDPIQVSVVRKEFVKLMHQGGISSKILDLKVDGKTHKVITKDIQFNKVNNWPTHIDFLRVSSTKKMHVSVPFEFINEENCPGLKQGGILNHVLHEIEIACFANNMPEKLVVDLESIEMGGTIHTADIKLPEGVEVLHLERDNTIATITAPKVSAEPEAAAEGEAAEGGEEAKAGGEEANADAPSEEKKD